MFKQRCVKSSYRQKSGGNGFQSIFRPTLKPINRSIIHDCWKLSSSISKSCSDGGETKNAFYFISNSIDEKPPAIFFCVHQTALFYL